MQLQALWLVALVGEAPAGRLAGKIDGIMTAGEPIALPEPVVATLLDRRAQATKSAPWVERHYR